MADEDSEATSPSGRWAWNEVGHVSVLLKEAIDFLAVRRGGTYIDATVGLGGHSYEIAKRLGAQGHLIGFDKDPAALEAGAREVEQPRQSRSDWPEITLLHGSFAEVGRACRAGESLMDCWPIWV